MSIKHLSVHSARAGDTLASLVSRYRLSSARAITDIPANKSIRTRLLDTAELAPGLMIHIAPNAGQLVKERLYVLHALRPAVIAHFDELAVLHADLEDALRGAEAPLDYERAWEIVSKLAKVVLTGIDNIALRATPLVEICQGMVHTHVAQNDDSAAVSAARDAHCGLYWCIAPATLELWRDMWTRRLWLDKWQDQAADRAWLLATRYLNTVRSIVIQQIDQRIREAQMLEQSLLQEAGR